jgi:uncharacterized protein (DUF1778 family)
LRDEKARSTSFEVDGRRKYLYGNFVYNIQNRTLHREEHIMPLSKEKKPDSSTKRSERLDARVTPEQKRLLLKAAALKGSSLTEFLVSSAQEAAYRTIQKHEVIKLGERDRETFVNALLSEREPSEEAKQAAREYLESSK